MKRPIWSLVGLGGSVGLVPVVPLYYSSSSLFSRVREREKPTKPPKPTGNSH